MAKNRTLLSCKNLIVGSVTNRWGERYTNRNRPARISPATRCRSLTAIELSFLTERKMPFDNLAYRVDLDSVRGVVTTMVQTERYGTPLASALRVLSAEFRNDRMMRAEEKAARLPAIMTVPLILFILPVLFIVILGPAACSIGDAFSGDGPGSNPPPPS